MLVKLRHRSRLLRMRRVLGKMLAVNRSARIILSRNSPRGGRVFMALNWAATRFHFASCVFEGRMRMSRAFSCIIGKWVS